MKMHVYMSCDGCIIGASAEADRAFEAELDYNGGAHLIVEATPGQLSVRDDHNLFDLKESGEMIVTSLEPEEDEEGEECEEDGEGDNDL